MPDPGSAAPPTREQVFAWMRENPTTIAAAAEHFGIAPGTIKSWRSRYPGDAPPVAQPQPRAQPAAEPSPSPRARVVAEPPSPKPSAPPTPQARPAPAPKPPPPPKPNAAEALPADDRAELVAHVRLLRKRLVDIAKIVDRELERAIKDDRAPARFVDEMTRSAAATAGEMERVLKAHPGLMALVDSGNTTNADDEAASIEAVYLKD